MYLLDANVFIQSKNFYYSFDNFPGFWEWLDDEQDNGHIGSIRLVRDELLKGKDKLADWADERKSSDWFIKNEDDETQMVLSEISMWVMEQDFKESAKVEFLDCADPWLIAKAKAIGATVVTLEIYEPNIKKKVKIPNVCKAFDVRYINTFELIKERKAKFVVGGNVF